MKTIVIGETLKAACWKLNEITQDIKVHPQGYAEAALNGHRYMAIGGSPDDVCWLRAWGFRVEIVTVGDNISEEMWRRIRHVRSSNGGNSEQKG